MVTSSIFKYTVMFALLLLVSCDASYAGTSFVVDLLPVPGGTYLPHEDAGDDENANRGSVYVDLRGVTKYRISARGYEQNPPYVGYVQVLYSNDAGVSWQCLGSICASQMISGAPPGAPSLSPSQIIFIPSSQRTQNAFLRAICTFADGNGPFITKFLVQFYY